MWFCCLVDNARTPVDVVFRCGFVAVSILWVSFVVDLFHQDALTN
jgi:hypothetical protein